MHALKVISSVDRLNQIFTSIFSKVFPLMRVKQQWKHWSRRQFAPLTDCGSTIYVSMISDHYGTSTSCQLYIKLRGSICSHWRCGPIGSYSWTCVWSWLSSYESNALIKVTDNTQTFKKCMHTFKFFYYWCVNTLIWLWHVNCAATSQIWDNTSRRIVMEVKFIYLFT